VSERNSEDEREGKRKEKRLPTVILHCSDGPDSVVCVCIAIIVTFFDMMEVSGKGTVYVKRKKEREREEICKKLIRSVFLSLLRYYPQARPPQVMMKMVTRYFLSPMIYL
jgi:hypothetical protein